MVLAETLNLHVSFDSFLFFFLLLFFFFSLSILSSARAQSAWRTVYSKEDNFIINHWVQNHCTLIVTYCITSNAEHVATLRASVEYYQLESTKSILMSPERLTVLWNLSSLLWFSFQSISQTCRMYKNRFRFTIDSTSLERCPGPRSDLSLLFAHTHVFSSTLSSEDCANLPPAYRFGDNVGFQAVPNRAGFHC